MHIIRIIIVLAAALACSCKKPESRTRTNEISLENIVCHGGVYQGKQTILCRADCPVIRAASYGDGETAVVFQTFNKIEHQFRRDDDDPIWHALRCIE